MKINTPKISVNPDKDKVAEIRQAVKDNDGYCPCQLERNEDTKCICNNFLKQEESGWCHCGLYYKEVEL